MIRHGIPDRRAPGSWYSDEADALARLGGHKHWFNDWWKYEDTCERVRDYRADIERRTINQTYHEERFLCGACNPVQRTVAPHDKASLHTGFGAAGCSASGFYPVLGS